MKSLALILIASGFPLLLSSQKAQYPDFNQYFDDFYSIELSPDSSGCHLVFQLNQDHLNVSFENGQVKLTFVDSSLYSEFYNTYIYELHSLLRFTHLNIDSILNHCQDCTIHQAKKRLKQSFLESGYSDVYYNYVLNDAIEVTVDSLSRVYAYCFSVLRLKPEPIFHWCSYKGPIDGPQQNFLIVYCEKMRIQLALGDLPQELQQKMFTLSAEFVNEYSEETARYKIEEEFRKLFNSTPAVREAIIAYYNSDKNKVIKLID